MDRDSIRRACAWVLRAGLVLALVWGWLTAVSPSSMQGDWFPHADKVRHAGAFAVFALWVLVADLRPRWLWAAALLAYGVGIEWAQSYVPQRDASWGDVVADAMGIALGIAAGLMLERRWVLWWGTGVDVQARNANTAGNPLSKTGND